MPDPCRAVVAELAKRFPQCFFLAGHERRPLKVGIGDQLRTLELGIDAKRLDSAMRWYTGSFGYLGNLIEGAVRVGLDGYPAGTVTAGEAEHARHRIARMNERLKHSAPNDPAPAQGRPADTPAPETGTKPPSTAKASVGSAVELREAPAGLSALKAAAAARRQACH